MISILKNRLYDKSILAFLLLSLFANVGVWIPTTYLLSGLLFLFLPGWGILLLLRTRGPRAFQASNAFEDFAFSGALSVTLFPMFVMTLMILFKYFPLKVGSLILLDMILMLVVLFYKKEKELNTPRDSSRDLMGAWKILMVIIVLALLLFDVLCNYRTFYLTIPNNTFVPWDHVLFFRLTQEFRFGTYPPPALCNLPFKVEYGTYLYFLSPTFVLHAILLEVTNMSIIPYAIAVSAYFHLLVVLMFFLVTKHIFEDVWAASMVAFCLSFSSDLMGLVSPASPYRGVPRPVLAESSFLYYPVTTSSVDLTARGFYSASAYLLIALILALLPNAKKLRSIGLAAMLILLINPVQAMTHLGIVGIFLSSFTATLIAKFLVNKRLLPDQFHGFDSVFVIVSLASFLVFGLASYVSLQFSIFGGYLQFRSPPLFENLASILAYFGVVLPLSLSGLISATKRESSNLSTSVIANWAIIGFLFASFVDVHVTGFIDNAPIHFSWNIPMIMLAGLGFASLLRRFLRARTNNAKKFALRPLNGATFYVLLVVIAMFASSFTTARSVYYTDLGPISRDYYGSISAYSWSEAEAYSWISDQTTEISVFLVSPSHWWFSGITGRQVVYTRQYNMEGSPNEFKIEQEVDAIFTEANATTRVATIEGFGIDFVFVGPTERDRYGYDILNKLLRNNMEEDSYFTQVFSNSEVTILTTPRGLGRVHT